MKCLALIAILLTLAGCGGEAREMTSAPATANPERQAGVPLDAQPRVIGRLALRIYELKLPAGTFTREGGVWRILDERVIDVGPYDVLWANGVRAGVGEVRDLDRFADILGTEAAPTTILFSSDTGPQVQEIDRGPAEVEGLAEQTLFWFDAQKRPHGRTYVRSRNSLALEMQPTPGREDEVRVSLTPIVRSERKRIDVRRDGSEFEVTETRDEAIFDLNLTVDVPIGQFLLVAPSPDAERATSIGRNFFTDPAAGPRREVAYLIVPQRITMTRQP